MTALVSYGCHNEVPQTGWLKTTGIYCLTVLEARSPKLRCHRAVRSLRLQGENSFHASLLASGASQQSLMFLGLLLHHASPCYWFQMAFSVSVFLFPVTGLESTIIHYELIPTGLHLPRPCLWTRSHSQVLGVGIHISSGRNTIQPITETVNWSWSQLQF